MKELSLNTILKLSLIVLALAGVYYFVSTAQLKNNSKTTNQTTQNHLSASEEIAWKQKCEQVGEDYFKNLQTQWPGPWDANYAGLVVTPENPEFAYNQSLNTCLINYILAGPYKPVFGPQSNQDILDQNSPFNSSGIRVQHYIDDTLANVRVAGWDDLSNVKPPRKTNGTYMDWYSRVQGLMVKGLK